MEVTSNAHEVAVKYTNAQNVTAKNLVPAMRRIGMAVQAEMVKNQLSGGSLNFRSGNLRRSVQWVVELLGNDAVARVFVDSGKAIYGRIQALGGVIRPKKGKYLTIPVGAALTGKGVAKFTAKQFIEAKGRMAGFDGEFVNRRRTAIMGVRNGHAEPVFALKTEVKIKATNYHLKAVAAKRVYIEEQLGAVMDQTAKEL